MHLLKEDLLIIVDRSETGLTDPRKLPRFNQRKDKALATIVLAVEPKLLYLLGGSY